MSLNEFEILLFKCKSKSVDISSITPSISEFMNNTGYGACIIDNNIGWSYDVLEQYYLNLSKIEVTEEMVKNKAKKVVILQTRNFKENDLIKVKELINNALLEYELDICLIDESIKLDKVDTFMGRIKRLIGIYDKKKKAKSDEFARSLKHD